MHPRLHEAYINELRAADSLLAVGDPDVAFAHLERAHILAQRSAVAHVRVHWAMLRFGWRRRDAREVAGQITRMIAASLFSRIWVPDGNTGGANVSAFKPMPVPVDLRELLDKTAS